MKKVILVLMIGFLLIGVNLYAADGDLIVEGKVGIGTNAPEDVIHAKSSNSTSRLIVETTASDGNATVRLVNDARAWAFGLLGSIGNGDVFSIRDGTADKQRLIVDTSGKIGINQESPNATLEIDTISATTKGSIIKASASQSANLSEWQDSSGSVLVTVASNGKVGIGTTTPTAKLDVNGSTGYNQLRLRTAYTPTGISDANGNVGDITRDDNYVYVKTSAGWKRASLTTW